jgi:photosynthetic reaction center H subunit
VALTAPLAARTVLMPSGFASLRRKTREAHVYALLGAQFANVPTLRNADQVTLLEEDKISGYFAGGLLYATPERSEPLI